MKMVLYKTCGLMVWILGLKFIVFIVVRTKVFLLVCKVLKALSRIFFLQLPAKLIPFFLQNMFQILKLKLNALDTPYPRRPVAIPLPTGVFCYCACQLLGWLIDSIFICLLYGLFLYLHQCNFCQVRYFSLFCLLMYPVCGTSPAT